VPTSTSYPGNKTTLNLFSEPSGGEFSKLWGLIGLWMGTTWLACCVQACCGQARQVPQPLDWFVYAGIQVELRCCLVTCMSNAKVIFCVCTLSHALTLAPPEPGSQETADLLVPPEPGREASFACAQPG